MNRKYLHNFSHLLRLVSQSDSSRTPLRSSELRNAGTRSPRTHHVRPLFLALPLITRQSRNVAASANQAHDNVSMHRLGVAASV